MPSKKEYTAKAQGLAKRDIRTHVIKTRIDSAVRRSLSNVVDNQPISWRAGELFKKELRMVVAQVRDITYFGSLLGNYHILRLLEENEREEEDLNELPMLDASYFQQCFRTICGKEYSISRAAYEKLEGNQVDDPKPYQDHLMKFALQTTYNVFFSDIPGFQDLASRLGTLDCKSLSALLHNQAVNLAGNLSVHVSENFDKLILKLYAYEIKKAKGDSWTQDKCKKLANHVYKLASKQETYWPTSIDYDEADDMWLAEFADSMGAKEEFKMAKL